MNRTKRKMRKEIQLISLFFMEIIEFIRSNCGKNKQLFTHQKPKKKKIKITDVIKSNNLPTNILPKN